MLEFFVVVRPWLGRMFWNRSNCCRPDSFNKSYTQAAFQTETRVPAPAQVPHDVADKVGDELFVWIEESVAAPVKTSKNAVLAELKTTRRLAMCCSA